MHADQHHETILKWVRLSKQLKFDIIIRNYSNHRHNILDDFLSLVTKIADINQENLKLLEKPNTPIINRSMTLAEYAVLQCFNSVDPNFSKCLSDAWCEGLPAYKSETPTFSKEVFLRLKQRYHDILLELNDCLMVSEKVFFEENNGARQATKNVANLSQDQISIFKQLFQQRMNELQEKNQLPKFEFDANVYLELNPDVKEAGVNPISTLFGIWH